MKPRDLAIRILFIAIIILFIAAAVIVILNLDTWMGTGIGSNESAWKQKNKMERVSIDGEDYWQKSNLSTYLIIGVENTNEPGKLSKSGSFYNLKMADFLVLLVFDHTAKDYSLIAINRDTMAEVPQLGSNGRRLAQTTYEQITAAYSQGSGLEDSCENTVEAVSELFYGLKIDGYFSMTLEGIPILNDYVGGVTVTLNENISGVGSAGETVHLMGDTASAFVRARMYTGDGSNLSRMERQKQYVNAVLEQLKTKNVDENYLLNAVNQVSDYVISSLPYDHFATYFKEYTFNGIVSPAGEEIISSTLGEVHAQFIIDDADKKAIALKYFYEKR